MRRIHNSKLLLASELDWRPLKEACDRDWEDETPQQIIAIAANALYWATRKAAAPSVQAETPTGTVTCNAFEGNGPFGVPAQPASPDAPDSLAEIVLRTFCQLLDEEDNGAEHTAEEMTKRMMDAITPELEAQRQAGEQAGLERAAQLLESTKQMRAGSEILRGIFDGEDKEGWRDLSSVEVTLLKSCAKAIHALLPNPKLSFNGRA